MAHSPRWLKLLGLLTLLAIVLVACGQTPAASTSATDTGSSSSSAPTAASSSAPTTAAASSATQMSATTAAAPASTQTGDTSSSSFRPTKLFEIVDKLKAATQGKQAPANAKFAFLTNAVAPFWTAAQIGSARASSELGV